MTVCTSFTFAVVSTIPIVPLVSEPGGALETRATFVVENGRPGAQEA
ncbi:MAG: hypothetical protein IIA90_08645 [Chloroflexi bacterium]|nr:hypothetical protein [Chloroflexota bacterium]